MQMARLLASLLGVGAALVVERNASSDEVPNRMMLPPRGGVFCRGNGCPFGEVGVVAGQQIMGQTNTEQGVEQQAKAALAIGMDALLARKEFCRGMSCVDGMGKPLDRTKATFAAQCIHFFEGSLEGHDDYRTVKQVYDSFGSICGPRVGLAEMPLCRAYGDVFAAALAPEIQATTVGSAQSICNTMFDFFLEMKQAQIDLQLFEGSLGHLDTAGPETPRGRRWAKFVEMSAPKPLNETHGSLDALQVQSRGDKDADKYQITMPSWDGTLKPTRVPGMLFDHCETEMKEIMLEEPQTSGRVSQMAVDWCNFQQLRGGGRSDWSERTCLGIGKLFGMALRNIPDPPPLDQPPVVLAGALPKPTFGQLSPTMPPTYTMMPTIPDPPKWGEPPVSGPVPPKMSKEQMQRMLDPVARFLLRPDQVCQQLFVAIGATTRVEGLLRNSFKTSFRVPTAGMSLPTKDDLMLQAMQQAAEFRKSATQEKEAQAEKAKAELRKAAADVVKPAEIASETAANLNLGSLPHSSDYNPKVTVGGSFLRLHR
mmetsp:Transcript_60716/g.113479  ORF Transcript_60716/g.113479 Transcript_60716/m.113479 type:complete len:539 (+) Transcript_60716:75-1691(+)